MTTTGPTSATPTVPGGAAGRATSWRYRDPGGRDLRLDLLRGYALLAMSINHTGLDSWWRTVTGGSVFLVNAAEVFFAVSGLTLGIISSRIALRPAVERVLERTWVVYLTVVALGLGLSLVTFDGGLRWLGYEAGSGAAVVSHLAAVLTLREAPNGSDVLVAYVGFLAVTPLVLWLLARGRTSVVLAGAAAIYLLSQVAPASVELPLASFRNLAANNLVFVVPLVLGWHREAVRRWAALVPVVLRRGADLAVLGAGVVLAALHATDYSTAPWLGEQLAGGFGEREAAMPVVPLLVVALYLRWLWVAVTWAWTGLERGLGWLLLPLGQASLFTYGMHLVLIEVMFLVPAVERVEDDRLLATAVLTVYVAGLYGAVLLRRALRSAVLAGPAPWPAVARRVPVVGTGALVAVVAVHALTLPGPVLPSGAELDEDEWEEELGSEEWEE